MSVGTYSERSAAKAGENDGFSVPWSRQRPKPRRAVSASLVSAVTILVLLAAWTVSASLQLVSPVFLPSPAAVWAKFVIVARDGFVDATLLQHLLASLWRVFAALIAAILVGVPVGLAIGISRIGRGVFDPLLEFLRPIPPLAYLPLIIIWFGIGEPSKILVIAIAMLAPVALSTAAGVRGVSRERVDAARSLGATRAQVIRHV
ncbi:ABC transporter permease subunit, partial [Mesorhizobium sp. M2D.F.Ca.ET.223.01.1.1]|uniref:ABC transporter permease subunit n=1 Tax=Mesorhizobium sp. M2D.F.Ca.ET.223.01.1.1 TaxID=2563940 RepID=UPI001092C271